MAARIAINPPAGMGCGEKARVAGRPVQSCRPAALTAQNEAWREYATPRSMLRSTCDRDGAKTAQAAADALKRSACG